MRLSGSCPSWRSLYKSSSAGTEVLLQVFSPTDAYEACGAPPAKRGHATDACPRGQHNTRLEPYLHDDGHAFAGHMLLSVSADFYFNCVASHGEVHRGAMCFLSDLQVLTRGRAKLVDAGTSALALWKSVRLLKSANAWCTREPIDYPRLTQSIALSLLQSLSVTGPHSVCFF